MNKFIEDKISENIKTCEELEDKMKAYIFWSNLADTLKGTLENFREIET